MKMYSSFLARGLAAVVSIAAVGGGTIYASSIVARNDLIDLGEAENFALIDANVKRDNVSNMFSHLKRDDGQYIYEVKFYAGDYEYDYEILAEDGSVREKDRETWKKSPVSSPASEKPAANTNGSSKSSTSAAASADSKKSEANSTAAADTPSGQYISLEKAKQIALEDAGYTEDQVRFSTAKFEDDDDDGENYEIEFYYGNMEYEYEIDAMTGEILDFSAEADDD